MPAVRLRRLTAALLLPLALACGSEQLTLGDTGDPTTSDPRSAVVTGDLAADRATLARLEAEVRTIARTEGCRAGECAAQPVGAKACGGPRYYVPYCRLTTDVARLERHAAAIERFERLFNERYGIVSTCEFVMPPELAVVGGACAAAGR
jgi:hypothetical protein